MNVCEYRIQIQSTQSNDRMTGKMISEMLSDKGKFAQMEYSSPLDSMNHTITPF